MIEILLAAVIVLVILNIIIQLRNAKNDNFGSVLKELEDKINVQLKENGTTIREEFAANREEMNKALREQREELTGALRLLGDQLMNRFDKFSGKESEQFEKFELRLEKSAKSNEEQLSKIEARIEKNLTEIRTNNETKLEEMRVTVDEKLHATLEKRLGESFKQVSERLEAVHKGLGDMQNLATGVGDLKRVLTNVKTRGTWGEFQLGHLIEQILTPGQFETNVATKKGSDARVEFAIKLPGRGDKKEEIVWLPIDSKFPKEDFERLLHAQETANTAEIAESRKGLERAIKSFAKDISTKYLAPPETTDFAIMFLPIESLYAEILSIPDLADYVQRTFRVTIAGPTNLLALLNSLQMGFKTLAIEKRSSEVWKLLSAVKTEFGKFGDILEKTQKKLETASNSIGEATRKTRTIERKLRGVEELPSAEAVKLIGEEE
jgi:DNA recombination protein RmuC